MTIGEDLMFKGFVIVSREERDPVEGRKPFDILYYTADRGKQFRDCVECLTVTEGDFYTREDIVYHRWLRYPVSWSTITKKGEQAMSDLIKRTAQR